MRIDSISVRFAEEQRPAVLITYDKPLSEANPLYIAAKHKETQCWVYRGQDGEYIHCGVEVRPPGKQLKQQRVRMRDGLHPVWPLQATNSVAINSLMRFESPVMEAMVRGPAEGAEYVPGHADAITVARYLWAAGEPVGMACMEWPSGIRVYEPVRLFKDEAGAWDAKPNRAGDQFRFLVTPEDGLSSILAALHGMK